MNTLLDSNAPDMSPMTKPAPSLADECNRVRAAVKTLEIDCRALKDKIAADSKLREQKYPGQDAEMLGQITLAFRHLEDARMRIGKVIQYSEDGVSVYDK